MITYTCPSSNNCHPKCLWFAEEGGTDDEERGAGIALFEEEFLRTDFSVKHLHHDPLPISKVTLWVFKPGVRSYSSAWLRL